MAGVHCVIVGFSAIKQEINYLIDEQGNIEKVEEYAKSIEAKKLVIPASITGNEFYYKLGYTYKDNKKELNEEQMYIMEKML